MFDLLTALLDSWSLWDEVAGGEGAGRRWRRRYLRITYGTGAYRPYEEIVAEAARDEALAPGLACELVRRWDELAPWTEAPDVLRRLREAGHRLAVVTNCSQPLAERAAARLGIAVDVLVSAEEAGFYKPRPEPYRLALERLGVRGDAALFVAGSPGDVGGAGHVDMPVVWHNRAGLAPEGPGEPLATITTLDPLPELAAGSA